MVVRHQKENIKSPIHYFVQVNIMKMVGSWGEIDADIY